MGESRFKKILKSLVFVDIKRRKQMLRRQAWAAIILAHVGLLCAWILPGTFDTSSQPAVLWTWAMMLVCVGYFHIGQLLLFIGLAAAFKKKLRMAACCLPLVVLTVILPFCNFGLLTQPSWSDTKVKIISANLLMINQNTQPLLDEIAQADADVIFLQEYTAHWEVAFQKRFDAAYPHRITYPQEDSFGAAIYSRLPFVGIPLIDADIGKWSVAQLRAVVDVRGTPVECWNMHLTPPRTMDYTIEHFDEMQDLLPLLAGIRDKPVIIAGDFNFTGSTMQARAIEATGFRDAFDQAGTGRGSTWPVNTFLRYLPGIRLDHVFLSPALTCRSINVGTGQGSDHRPLVADITLNPKR